tara:strand:+ start:78585 stop:79883 length:1299 start_codon:yes stop_codon:yes gene_type:complete
MENIRIFWFRRDLRLHDNCGLYNALQSGEKVLPIFIFDVDILSKLPKNDARVNFIHNNLQKMNSSLQSLGASIHIYHGRPLAIFEKLVSDYNISAVYTNHDYEPYATQRDEAVKDFLDSNSVAFHSFKDQVLFEKDEVTKADGKPYVVYTPYSRKWLERFHQEAIPNYPSEEFQHNFATDLGERNVTLEDIGFQTASIQIADYKIDSDLIDAYEDTRNFPEKDGTSKLGPHLRFGTVSVRQMIEKANKSDNITFLKELIWREFFMQILHHFPHTTKDSFKSKYDRIEWRNNEEEFKKWCEGKTGYPLVDAGMRELNATGFMHNRIRMLTGSFLCKHLLIDWRWGEAYFAEKLNDYEQASNIGNWQWVAGSGVDAAPYFRIFNPTTQIQKFDKKHTYIKKWVPNYQDFDYPQPIVDHKFARERCLKVYKEALD